MELTRREFLKMAGFASAGVVVAASAGSLLTGCSPVAKSADGSLAGKQLGMLVVPSRCKERCTDCIDACHLNHNVPELKNKKHEIKWIWETEIQHAFPEYMENELLKERMEGVPFLVLCNHCANPACVRVCPTKATYKREDGAVMMDYHRCIGCRFCVAACPYGARSFNFEDPRNALEKDKINRNFPTRTKGVVEKCNFCVERNIYGGELPYCVEACMKKNGKEGSALYFGDFAEEHSEVKSALERLQKEEKLIPLRRKEIAGTQPKVYYMV
ncbi:MAG: 4Fe-4S dicluster domain-containing protein [Chloroflexi bacterium]|nr:4Fe-4S dicluster domain-containing protein [Chloroflexota bacterium]